MSYDILDFFPKGKENIRFTQTEILKDIKEQFDKNKKFIIIEAPTGTGKSDVNATVLLYQKGGTILTTQKILQNQYEKEFEFMRIVKGKNEFDCHQEDDVIKCDEGQCNFPNGKMCKHFVFQENVGIQNQGTKQEVVILIKKSKKSPECSYFEQEKMGYRSSFAVYNYAKYLSSILKKTTKEKVTFCVHDWKTDEIDEFGDVRTYCKKCGISEENSEDEQPIIETDDEINPAQKNILICDEAQNLESQLADFGGINISTEHASKVDSKEIIDKILNIKNKWNEIEEYRNKTNEQQNRSVIESNFLKLADGLVDETFDITRDLIAKFDEKITKIKEEIAQQMENKNLEESQTSTGTLDDFFEKDFKNFSKTEKKLAKLQKELDELDFDKKNLVDFYEKRERKSNFVFGGGREDKKTFQTIISVKPIDVTDIAEKLFEKFKHVIFISSTIHKEFFKKEMGITNAFYKSYRSEFPPENRIIVKDYPKKMKLNFENSKKEIKKCKRRINQILDKHKKEKGIIHVTSFDLQNKVYELLSPENQKRIKKLENGDVRKKEDLVQEHKKSKDYSVILSPSCWEGMDLPNEDSRFQIIVKAPLLSLGDLRTKKKKDESAIFGEMWYKSYSLQKLIQGCGRSIRNKKDWATTYLLDMNCNDLLSYGMPEWFDESFNVKSSVLKEKYAEWENEELRDVIEKEFQSELNEEQKRAKGANKDKALMIQAGPGTGKTRMIVERVKDLILNQNVSNDEILCLTFTRIAQKEMQDRLQDDKELNAIPGKSFNPENVMTFHKLGLKILRDNPEKQISVIDKKEKESIIDQILVPETKSTGYRYNEEKRQISSGIEAHKAEGITPEEVSDYVQTLKDGWTKKQWEKFSNVFKKYNDELVRRDKIDFGDMLKKSLDRLNDDQEVLKKHRKNWKYVLVDEYQDNNYLQTQIAKKIAEKGRITVVGDKNQSIFEFQGANVKNFEAFKSFYEGNYEEYTLLQNYRSSQRIINVANSLIPKTNFHSENERGEKISVVEVENSGEEGIFVIQQINKYINENFSRGEFPISYRDYQIMARISSQINKIANQLELECIPFVTVINQEIRPNRKILNDLKNILTSIMKERNLEKNDHLTMLELLLKDMIEFEDTRKKYFISLKNLLVDFKRKHDADSLDAFIEYLKPENIINNCVILRTIHSSKGTERPITFILDVNQRSIPMEKEEDVFKVPNELRRLKSEQNEISKKRDEERRIFYVALTRAKNLMFILCTRKYQNYNGVEQNTIESEFLKQIDYKNNPDIDFKVIPKSE